MKLFAKELSSRPIQASPVPSPFCTKGPPGSSYLVHLEGSHQQVEGSLGSSWVELEKKRECIQMVLRELQTRPACRESKARPLQKGLASHAPVHTSLLGL